MWLYVDARSHTPMYQQIVDGVKEQVARGTLQPGDRMLTVRQLATTLSLNHNTVAKAYQELEREKVIELIRGRGTFVSMQAEVPDIENRKRELRDAMKRWLVDAHHLHMSDEEIASILQDLLLDLYNSKGGEEL